MTAPVGASPGTMYATFTPPVGDELVLTDLMSIAQEDERGYFTTREIAGWGARPYEIVVDPMPRGGDNVRFIRAQSGRITWPLHIWGETHGAFLERYREVKRAIMSTVHRRMPGVLTVWRPDGTSRAIDVYYEDGLTGEAGENWVFANPVITFFAPDGYWRDTVETIVTRGYSPGTSFFNPFPTISSSQVLGLNTVHNPGEVEAWPEWTITGPAESLTATNHSTGQSFVLTYSLAVGEIITITTLRPAVRGPLSENLVSALNWPAAELWPLVSGDNTVEFVVGGSATGTTIELSFVARYEGA